MEAIDPLAVQIDQRHLTSRKTMEVRDDAMAVWQSAVQAA